MEENQDKNKGGRPTTYSDDFVIKAKKYLEKSKDIQEIILSQQITTEKTINGAEFNETKTTKVGKQKVKLPSIEGLAKYLGVSRSNIYKWKDEHIKFSDILDEILEEQAERLINMGLSGEYNSTIAKLILTKHGYNDKTEIEESGEGEKAKKEMYETLKGKIDGMGKEEINEVLQELLK